MLEPGWTEKRTENLLRKHGLRVTTPRVAICMKLLRHHCHYTAQQLHEALVPQYPAMSQNTVYLTLNQLVSNGLIRSFSMAGNTVYDSNTEMHDHAHCRQCGMLKDLSDPPPPDKQFTGQIKGWELEWGTRLLSGICPTCKGQSATTPA